MVGLRGGGGWGGCIPGRGLSIDAWGQEGTRCVQAIEKDCRSLSPGFRVISCATLNEEPSWVLSSK